MGGISRAATYFARAERAPRSFALGLIRISSPDATLGDDLGRSVTQATTLPKPARQMPLLVVLSSMNLPPKNRLPHGIPLWVNPHREIYFITINCEKRFQNQLAVPAVATPLFATVRHRQEKFLWWPHVFLLMPDHLHALFSFPPSDKPIRLIIAKWKEWTAKTICLHWQPDFFEHRLRHDESLRQKATYILENPVRKNLVTQPKDWPFVYFGDGERSRFLD